MPDRADRVWEFRSEPHHLTDPKHRNPKHRFEISVSYTTDGDLAHSNSLLLSEMASVPTTRHSSRNSTSPNSKRPVASPKTPVRASSKRSFAAVTPAALLAGSGSDVFQPSHSELTNSRSPKRRKMAAGTGSGTGQATIEVIDLTGDPPLRQQDDCAKSPTSSKRGKLTASPGQRVEKRLKRYTEMA